MTQSGSLLKYIDCVGVDVFKAFLAYSFILNHPHGQQSFLPSLQKAAAKWGKGKPRLF
jgi:hypothetical protein